MTVITETSSLEDVCFAVCTALQQVGTIAVLTGGSAATYYAPESYQSQDADFVITFSSDRTRAAQSIAGLGYREVGGTYRHDRNIFTLEFPPGPLSIGGELIRNFDTAKRGDDLLYVLSRTDCVRDRLAAYYFFSDRSALAAAIAVATSGVVDLAVVRQWSVKEGESSRFAEFYESVQSPPGKIFRHDRSTSDG